MEKNESDKWLKRANAIAEDITEMESIDVIDSYNRIKRKVVFSKRMRLFNNVMKYAALIILPIFIASVSYFFMTKEEQDNSIQYAQVTSSSGTVIRYELPDKSIVWLNSGSKLVYPTSFNGNIREVKLVGEAYFEVKADKEHPFYVNTREGFNVFVYGTKFNISAYDNDEEISVVLEQGKVNVISPANKKILMNPGEQMLYNKNNHSISRSKVNVYDKIAWKDGKMIFRNVTLDVLFKKLARHYNVDIEFNNRHNRKYRYRATFRDETLLEILDYLKKSTDMDWKIVGVKQNDDDTFTKKKIIIDLN